LVKIVKYFFEMESFGLGFCYGVLKNDVTIMNTHSLNCDNCHYPILQGLAMLKLI
jgi:hypothetical protein